MERVRHTLRQTREQKTQPTSWIQIKTRWTHPYSQRWDWDLVLTGEKWKVIECRNWFQWSIGRSQTVLGECQKGHRKDKEVRELSSQFGVQQRLEFRLSLRTENTDRESNQAAHLLAESEEVAGRMVELGLEFNQVGRND